MDDELVVESQRTSFSREWQVGRLAERRLSPPRLAGLLFLLLLLLLHAAGIRCDPKIPTFWNLLLRRSGLHQVILDSGPGSVAERRWEGPVELQGAAPTVKNFQPSANSCCPVLTLREAAAC
ncbi:hypothetical protein E2C01_086646 [Portunus trituberculatus]|uniref:Uncharacterized protein n=1 Tax=Portunus trituberculatus TaxID=210409 RepID=A0A5B7J4C3_PORTR|nr:hypothetical protein [Portunus trituberculatus]